MRRREFITLLGGAASWPLAARAQGERARRIGVLLPAASDDVEFQARVGAFLQRLGELGWTIGRNPARSNPVLRSARATSSLQLALACRRGDRMRRRE